MITYSEYAPTQFDPRGLALDGADETRDGDSRQTLWQEYCCYHVDVVDPVAGRRVAWESTTSLSEARAIYRRAVRICNAMNKTTKAGTK